MNDTELKCLSHVRSTGLTGWLHIELAKHISCINLSIATVGVGIDISTYSFAKFVCVHAEGGLTPAFAWGAEWGWCLMVRVASKLRGLTLVFTPYHSG